MVFWLGLDAPFEPKTIWISIAALVTFVGGYLLPAPGLRVFSTSPEIMDRCEELSYKATVLLALPVFLVALRYALYRSSVDSYFEGEGISLPEQGLMYVYLFFNLLYVSAVASPKKDRTKLILVIFLAVAPRLLISFWWRRFYVAQALVPIVFIAMARGWVTVTLRRLAQVTLIALFVLFVPAITRGDNVFGQDEEGNPQIVNYFGYMNTLVYFQDNTDLEYPCPPLLVSLTAKIVPYPLLGACTIHLGDTRVWTATLDRLLARRYTDDIMAGTGGNYLLELWLSGGMTAILIGSAVFGFTCRWFVASIGYRSLYAGIWAECLSRALFAPRQTVGYVYERIPSEVVAALAVIVFVWAFSKLNQPISLRAAE